MTKLTALLDRALLATNFRTSRGTDYSVEELRQALAQARGSLSKTREFLTARPQVDDVHVGYVTDHLRDRLSEYIEVATDRIGHSFRVLGDSPRRFRYTPDNAEEIQSTSYVPGFARGLVRAAAVLGPDRADQLLSLWADGNPRQYRICIVLAGAYVDEDIKLEEGLRVYRLPVSSDLLPVSMPDTQPDNVSTILRHTTTELDASTHPAFFVPMQDDKAHTSLHSRTALGEVSVKTFFLALSLVCNERVGLAWSWRDYGDASSFTADVRSGLGGPGMQTDVLSTSWSSEAETGITELTSYTNSLRGGR